MNLREAVQWLLDNDYGIMVGKQFVLTQKVSNELGGFAANDETPVAIPIRTARTITRPTETDKKAVWNKFVEDAEVPWRVKAPDGGIYTVRQYSVLAANNLIKIINDPNIDYVRLTQSTKNYYQTVTYKKLLSNYLNDGIWKSAYDEWGKEIKVDGENKWED